MGSLFSRQDANTRPLHEGSGLVHTLVRDRFHGFQWQKNRVSYRWIDDPDSDPPKALIGGLRWGWQVNIDGRHYVAKRSKQVFDEARESRIIVSDIIVQTHCKRLAEEFNRREPPKKVEYNPCYIFEIQTANGRRLYFIEPFMAGQWQKHINNHPYKDSHRWTPAAFSHFTYHNSKGFLVVVDIQGVDDKYSDPQIHTRDGRTGGQGNLGPQGIEIFRRRHRCNRVCEKIGLRPIGEDDSLPEFPTIPATLEFLCNNFLEPQRHGQMHF